MTTLFPWGPRIPARGAQALDCDLPGSPRKVGEATMLIISLLDKSSADRRQKLRGSALQRLESQPAFAGRTEVNKGRS